MGQVERRRNTKMKRTKPKDLPITVTSPRSVRSLSKSSPVTLKDVGNAAGVSAVTVSYVLNNTGSVSPEVRLRVQKVADRLGYRPNKSAKAIRTGRSQTLGLIVNDMGNPFYAEFAQAAERAAAAFQYAVLLVDAHASSADADARIDSLRNHPVDGVIASMYTPSIARLKLPIVVISGAVSARDSVSSDDVAGGTLLADRLLELGHRKFGLITSPLPGGIPVRRDAFVARLPKVSNVVWECVCPATETISEETRAKLARREVTAIICSNDMIAVGALRALRELGIEVPQEVSVVGYDDIAWAGIVTPSLTTIRQPFTELATKAMELLLDRLEHPARRLRHITLGVTMIERESIGPAPLTWRSKVRAKHSPTHRVNMVEAPGRDSSEKPQTL